jgi:pyruvate formate-lyase activating enzyme-like uncharacterized protein
MPVTDDADILFEAKAIKSEGAGISGGDPLCDLDRTLNYIRLLKQEYGPNFHLHLYTSQNDVSEDVLRMKQGLMRYGFTLRPMTGQEFNEQ